MPRLSRRGWIVAAALVVLAAAAVVRLDAVVGFGSDSETPSAAPTKEPGADLPGPATPSGAPPTVPGPEPPDIDSALMRGSKDAPVTMVVFGDYQCPYCATFSEEQQPRLVREYVAEGELRLAWRDYPYRGEDSKRAAVAARAASHQDAFWEYNEALYADTTAWSGGSTGDFVRIAADLGLDTERFRADMDDPQVRGAVEDDEEFALSLGVPGTPAFLINGEAFFGAQPYTEFEERIEAERDSGS